MEGAMNEYDRLFEAYVADLRKALEASRLWRDSLIAHEVHCGATSERASALVEARWPFGPSTHPWVLGVYHKYFLLVSKLSDSIAARVETDQAQLTNGWGDADDEADDEARFDNNAPIAPWMLLVDALRGEYDEFANAMTWIIYQPVGLDENDQLI
jgi:hypothetical protein